MLARFWGGLSPWSRHGSEKLFMPHQLLCITPPTCLTRHHQPMAYTMSMEHATPPPTWYSMKRQPVFLTTASAPASTSLRAVLLWPRCGTPPASCAPPPAPPRMQSLDMTVTRPKGLSGLSGSCHAAPVCVRSAAAAAAAASASAEALASARLAQLVLASGWLAACCSSQRSALNSAFMT